MKNRRIQTTGAMAALLFSAGVRSQVRIEKPSLITEAQLRQLIKNTSRLKVTVALDRDVYFPGEEAKVSLVVKNTTSDVLQVLEPFTVGTGGLNILVHEPAKIKTWGTEWFFLRPHQTGVAELALDAPSRYMQPGEELRLQFTLAEGCKDRKTQILADCHLPEPEGEYRLQYNYLPIASALFRIVVPRLESWTEAAFEKPYVYHEIDVHLKQTGKIQLIPRRMRLVVLEYQGEHILGISVNELVGDSHIPFGPGGFFTGPVSRYFVTSLRRLASSAKPIISLQMTADAAENLTIAYTDQDGQRFTLKLDPKRNLVP